MNERIEKLAEQQGFTGPNFYISSSELEKFAELIIKECLDVVELRRSRGPVEVCKEECKAVIAEINHHFGIEE